MTAYYNEIDPSAAQWLRNLIEAGHIAQGYVDERSIEDVYPSDLRGFTQCHFFAGIGVWSYALRLAGWGDDRPVWTGSCPCQPFSAAGKSAGFADERHLWPSWHHLIKECSPAKVFGEQVASKDAEPWLDLVHTDMEELGYAFGAVAFPSAGIGAPHIRDRVYWVANTENKRSERAWFARTGRNGFKDGGAVGGMGHSDDKRLERWQGVPERGDQCTTRENGLAGRMGYANDNRRITRGIATAPTRHGNTADAAGGALRPGPTNGFWRDADWLYCRDEKWRAVEPGTFPLADGSAARVVRLRAYGNAINAKAAQAFIECAA